MLSHAFECTTDRSSLFSNSLDGVEVRPLTGPVHHFQYSSRFLPLQIVLAIVRFKGIVIVNSTKTTETSSICKVFLKFWPPLNINIYCIYIRLSRSCSHSHAQNYKYKLGILIDIGPTNTTNSQSTYCVISLASSEI